MTPVAARAAIARHMLPATADGRLGEIVLAAHQAAAARRLITLLAVHGGALLADDVGLGKTFVALAVARHYARVLVIAPAGLRAMWHAASARAGIPTEITSYEALSRGLPRGLILGTGDLRTQDDTLVIMDEAHHARSPESRRYPRISALTSAAHTLMLTATPVHNRLEDLRTLVALFAGSRAWAMSEEELAAVVYRRSAASVPVELPSVAAPRWIEIDDDTACLDALLRVPPPVPPAGSGDGGVLLTIGLVRQWTSSRAALVSALRRSLARALATSDAVAAGHMPTLAELRAWHSGDDAMQLAFPELVASPIADSLDRHALAGALQDHADAVMRLLAWVAGTPDPDDARAGRILELRNAHAGEKIVCFTAYAETASAYWRRLRSHAGVARLTAHGGEIASGRVSRDAVLQRFAPHGQRVRVPSSIEGVTMLITTDLLSEGVDLRDATVVVHLDLPWTPARMEQRVGRARRMGSPAASISVYAMHPPASGEAVLELERRLREKTAIARKAVGTGVDVLPWPTVPAGSAFDQGILLREAQSAVSDAERRSAVIDRLAEWSQRGVVQSPISAAVVAATVETPCDGWLAGISVGHERLLVASLDGQTGSDAALIAAACKLAETGAVPVAICDVSQRAFVDRAIAGAKRYAAERAASDAVTPAGEGVATSSLRGRAGPVRSHALARVHRALAATPPHEAPRIARLAAAARRVVNGRLTAGMESRLHHLMTTMPSDDPAWLAAVGALARDAADVSSPFQVRALVVFVATPSFPG